MKRIGCPHPLKIQQEKWYRYKTRNSNSKQHVWYFKLVKTKAEYAKWKLDLSKIIREHFLQKRSDPYRKVMSVKRQQGKRPFSSVLVFNNCPTCTNEYRHWLHGPLGFNYIIRIGTVFSERSHPHCTITISVTKKLQLGNVFLSLPNHCNLIKPHMYPSTVLAIL